MTTKTPTTTAQRAKKRKQTAFKRVMAQYRRETLEEQDAIIAECQRQLRGPHQNFSDIARQSGLSSGTVARFAYGAHNGGTVRPAMTTVLAIFAAMGFQIDALGPKGQSVVSAHQSELQYRIDQKRKQRAEAEKNATPVKGATIHRLVPRKKR